MRRQLAPFLVALVIAYATAVDLCTTYVPLQSVLQNCNSIQVTANTAHVSHTASYLSPWVVMIGGYAFSTAQPVTTNTVMLYDPVAASSVLIPTQSIGYAAPQLAPNFQPGTRSEHTAVVWDNAIVIYGGQNTDFMGDMWRLCLAPGGMSGKWDQVVTSTGSSFPPGRKGHSATLYATNATAMLAVVFGGTLSTTYQDTNDTYFKIISKPSGSMACQTSQPIVTWQRVLLANMSGSPTPRSYHTMALNPPGGTFQSCLILYGGQSTMDNSILDEMWSLCPQDLASTLPIEQQRFVWTQLVVLGTSPYPRFGHTTTPTFPDRFLIFGGSYRFPTDYLSDAWEYNLSLQRWIQQSLVVGGSNINSPRRFHSMTYTAQRVLVILGGISRYELLDATSTQCDYTSSQCASGFVQFFCNATGQMTCQPCSPGYFALSGASNCSICPPGNSGNLLAIYEFVFKEHIPSLDHLSVWTATWGLIALYRELLHYRLACSALLECTRRLHERHLLLLAKVVHQASSLSLHTSLNCMFAGTFSNTSQSTSCLPCAPGTFSAANASTCSQCPIGTFSQGSSSACSNCSAGTYAPFTSMSACLACPLGMYSNISAGQCTGCPAGTYSNQFQAAFANCKPCPAGTYAESLGQSNCAICPDGTSSSIIGSVSRTTCILCPPGTFTSATNKSVCWNCPSGTFSNQSGTSQCTSCPANYYTNTSNASSLAACLACAVGTQFNSTAGLCSPCPPGSHRFQNTSGCALCPSGSYTSTLAEAQSPVCLPCPAMKANPSTGVTSCQTCAANSYSSNQWSSCLSCSSSCPIGRNGAICSNQGNCVYGGCICNSTYSGYTCETPLILNSTATRGIVYFATPNQTIFFDNVTNSVTLQREAGARGLLSVVVSLASGGNATVSNGGLPVGWSTSVIFQDQEMAKNISVPVRTVSQGCVSIVLALTDPFPLLHPSNVTSIDRAIVTLLVQATTISTASVNQVLATPTGYNISVAISNTANSVASMTLPPNGISTVNTYFYFDSNLDPWLIPLVPAMISSTQAQMAALPRTWLFSYHTRAAAPFGNDATGLLASLQTITSFPSTPFSGTFLNSTFLQSLPWTPGALRTIIIVTSATSLAADTNVYTMEQGCWTANVMPYFLVPTPNLPMISQLISALGFGTAMGYNIQSFVTGPFQLLQAPPIVNLFGYESIQLDSNGIVDIPLIDIIFSEVAHN
ncbi:hypothetical protein AeMF1_001134 [Aphanomyces euteiches]|nr:hypothetical protein AeMF1_001134 [Aphanomyces euteiches]KAH9192331.1 hypothetical protein AeNC1_005689 [Aphanomyces euteiches]